MIGQFLGAQRPVVMFDNPDAFVAAVAGRL